MTQDRQQQADKIIQTYSAASAATALIPLPLVDIAALTGVQIKMIHSLASLYDQPFNESAVRSTVSALLSSLLSNEVGKGIGSLLQNILPGGKLINLASRSGVNGALTFAVGKVFVEHFETGGTLLTFDAEKIKEHFASHVEAAKGPAEQSIGVKP